MLPLVAFTAYFVYLINFQRPKRYVSVGALNEVKPDVEGLGRLHQVLDFIPSRWSWRNFGGCLLYTSDAADE